MLTFFKNLDRRWIFLGMFLAVLVPLITQQTFPEFPSLLVQNAFDAVENMPSGSKVLLAMDYDPASEGELAPMATAFVRHLCEKRHKIYFLALWPVGAQMIQQVIDREIKVGYPEMRYGEDYVNLGYKSGNEGVIKVIVTDLKKLYTTDAQGTSLNNIPMTQNIKSIQDMDFLLNVSAGYPGTKEWVQYATSPYPKLRMVSGCTGVQAPLFYPYIPNQLLGMLGAIKGAAEYEKALSTVYPKFAKKELNEGLRRMAPQLWAHVLILVLIIIGNMVYFSERRKGAVR